MSVKPFDHYLAQVGYHDFTATPAPSKQIVYGYRTGELVFTGDTKTAAYDAGAVVVETADNPEYTQYRRTQQKLKNAAHDIWLADLYAEDSDLPNTVLTLVFARVWDNEHASGYDAVADAFSDECDYIRKCIHAAWQACAQTEHPARADKHKHNWSVQPPPFQTLSEGDKQLNSQLAEVLAPWK